MNMRNSLCSEDIYCFYFAFPALFSFWEFDHFWYQKTSPVYDYAVLLFLFWLNLSLIGRSDKKKSRWSMIITKPNISSKYLQPNELKVNIYNQMNWKWQKLWKREHPLIYFRVMRNNKEKSKENFEKLLTRLTVVFSTVQFHAGGTCTQVTICVIWQETQMGTSCTCAGVWCCDEKRNLLLILF